MTLAKQLIDNVNKIKTTLNEISVYNLDVKTSLELYYELAKKVNEVINELSRFEGLVSDEIVEQNKNLLYLLNEGLKEQVAIKIEEFLNNGTLENIINHKIFNDLSTNLNTFKQDVANQFSNVDKKIDYVTYEMFGAKGDGITNDYQAIKNAHDYANLNKLQVRCNSKVYYIGKCDNVIQIKTSTDFGTSTFIIDDTLNDLIRDNHIFSVDSEFSKINIPVNDNIKTSFKKGVKVIKELSNYGECVCEIKDLNKRIFLRKGINQDNGVVHVDYVRIDNKGFILDELCLDFDNVSEVTLYPIDKNIITVGNGNFITKSNNEEISGVYWKRGINCSRSNVVFYSINHNIEGEGEQGNPYDGFFRTFKSCNIVFRDVNVTPHKTFNQMGSYEIRNEYTINCLFDNVKCYDFKDLEKWGCHTSNFSKNLTFKNCELNRIDAHKGIYNLTLENTTTGCYGITAVGYGDLIINSSISDSSSSIVELRTDYGSTWDGRIIINNHKFITDISGNDISLIKAQNDGNHNFGYICKYPKLILENIEIKNSGLGKVYLTRNNNNDFGWEQYLFTGVDNETNYPYLFTDYIKLKDITTVNAKFNLFSKSLGNIYALNKCYIVDGDITPNIEINLENVDFEDKTLKGLKSEFTSNIFENYFALGEYHNMFKLSPKLVLKNIKGISISNGSNACKIQAENTIINQANMIHNSSSRSNLDFVNCEFSPLLREVTSNLKQVSFNPLYSNFVNCKFLKPNTTEISDFSITNVMEIYQFLKEIRVLNHFLECNLKFTNCSIYSGFDFTQMTGLTDYKKSFGIDLSKNFGDFNFNKIPRCWGYNSEKPSNTVNLVPIGFNYYSRSENSFSRWNGESWV